MKRVFLVSTVAHIALIASGAWIKPSAPAIDAPVRGVEMEFTVSAPPAAQSVAPEALPAPVAAPQAAIRVAIPVRNAPSHEARAARVVAPAAVAPSTVSPAPATVAPVAPATAVPAPPTINVAHLLTSAAGDVAAVGDPGATPADTTAATAREREARVREAAQGYVAEVIADANPIEPSQVHAYYGSLARRMRETWRPGFYRTPSMVDALIAMPRAMVHYREMYRRRAARFANTGRPDDPTQIDAMPSFEDRQSFAAALTSTIIEVEQDETGRVLSMRVIRPARVHDFDEAALAAVRAAIPDTSAVPMPGGRRSRWAFDVVASRDAIIPIAGFTFNESNGFFEMNYPGALHVRTRIRTIGSRPLNVPWGAPHPAAN